MKQRIAIIMTCHNRRDMTLRCLSSVKAQETESRSLDLFVTDDGCTDGTPDAIMKLWPNATVIRGTGSLYWAAGMALAERVALRTAPDYIFWLNDDTFLEGDAIDRLMSTARHYIGAIIVGATVDPLTGERTYGGRLRPSWHPQRFTPLPISDRPQRADTFNGNVVLIPWKARQKVGPIDGKFPHAYADDDYGLRATAIGIRIIQTPGAVGTCSRNPQEKEPSRRFSDRWQSLNAPDGLPWSAQARYLKRHGDWRWLAVLVIGQLRRLASSGSNRPRLDQTLGTRRCSSSGHG